MEVRSAELEDVGALAQVWYDGWRDAHAHLVPTELTQARSLASFTDRLREALPRVRVVGPTGAPIGFCIVKDEELDQLFVTARSRGLGAAAALIADAEARLCENGVDVAWLTCAVGNHRAAKFYEKCGWRRTGTMIERVETSSGAIGVEVWRFEKALVALRR
jgi:GNAT superfamily N-acetyltransferase